MQQTKINDFSAAGTKDWLDEKTGFPRRSPAKFADPPSHAESPGLARNRSAPETGPTNILEIVGRKREQLHQKIVQRDRDLQRAGDQLTDAEANRNRWNTKEVRAQVVTALEEVAFATTDRDIAQRALATYEQLIGNSK